jgi:hypothetical protein
MRKRDLIHIIESALVYKMDDGGDIPVIDCLLEDVRKTLKCDPRLSRLTCQEFNVLITAFADGARRLLDDFSCVEWEYAAQHVDWDYAARRVTDAVVYEMNNRHDPPQHQSSTEAFGAADVHRPAET